MTLFEQVKECVTARQAAEHYGIKVKRNGMACCPFHKDRHPSMKADKIYHCFACGVGGDAIDFTARLFGISQYEAAKKMIEDFGLDIKIEDRNKYKRTHQSRNTLISKKPKVVMIREKLEQWLKHATDVLIRYLKWIQFWKEIYKPEPDEEWHELFTEALANERKIKKVDTLVDDYGYNFVQENQLAKMTAAAYNSRVSAKWDNDTLYLSAAAKNEDIPLYDKNYQNSTGVKVIFADGVTVDEFNIDASVAYKKDNCVYASLDKGVKISKNGENKDINITSVNVPAKISKNDKGATIKFCDGGMMTVEVAGNARTTSKGWETTQQEGKTLFRKYGKAETLKITK